MKVRNIPRYLVLVISGFVLLSTLWTLDGEGFSYTFEEGLLLLLYAVLSVLVMNGNDQ
jgi:hypothetical protein